MNAPAFLAPHWKRYVSWFATLQPRERLIIAAAVLGGIIFLGFSYAIEPPMLAARKAAKAVTEANSSATQSNTMADLLQKTNLDPDAPLRTELAQLREQFAEQSRRFEMVERSLVPPEKIPALLESLLARSRGLQLKSLATLPPTPFIDRKPAAVPAAASLPAMPNLFKHGVTIKIAGTYPDLTAYLTELENSPQRLIWGRLELTAAYPVSEMTLTVYTLSLEKSWLVL